MNLCKGYPSISDSYVCGGGGGGEVVTSVGDYCFRKWVIAQPEVAYKLEMTIFSLQSINSCFGYCSY